MTTVQTELTFVFQYHERDNFFTRLRSDNPSDVPVHCMGWSDDSPEQSIYRDGDMRCTCCELNIPHSERKHDACMAWYWLTHKPEVTK